jgi:hypothetical protein
VSQVSSPPIGVAIVVDPAFGARLISLAHRLPIWVVASAANATFVDQARAVSGASVTTFDDCAIAPDSMAMEFLDSVLEHHPSAARIEIIGCTATQSLHSALRDAGLSLISEDAGLLVAVRPLTIGSSDRGSRLR